MFVRKCCCLISALSIGFQPSTYTTTEGSTVGVCVEVLSGSSAIPILISITTSEGTAEGSVHSQNNTVFHSSFFSGNDFEISDPVQLVLGSGTTSTCTDIATTHDEVYEDTESFTATLTTTNGDVAITIDSATILITDNDGGCLSVEICVHT